MAAPGRNRIYMASIVFCQVIVFLRYVALARILGPDQVGLMSILVLTASLFELITDFSVDRYLVVSPKGDDPRMQRVSHGITVVRGVLIAGMMLASAIPVAQLYGEPSIYPSLMVLAVYPLIAGFVHNDVRSVQRNMNFTPEAIVNISAECVAFVVTVVTAFVTQSYTAIVVGLIARSIAQLIATHAVAHRRYEIGFDRDYLRPMVLFALPLSLNGLLIYASGQGDRLVVGSLVGTRELGLYASTLLLILYPSSMIARFFMNTALPTISKTVWSDGGAGNSVHRLGVRFALWTLAMALGFAIVAPFAVPVLYGAAFQLPLVVIGLIGMLQGARFAQQWLGTSFMAIDQTRGTLTLNIIRIIGVLLCLPVIFAYPTLTVVVSTVFAAEAAALLIGIVLVNRAIKVRWYRGMGNFGAILLTLILFNKGVALMMDGSRGTGPVLLAASLLLMIGWLVHRRAIILDELSALPVIGPRLSARLR